MARKHHDPVALRGDRNELLKRLITLENLAHRVGQTIIMPAYRSQNFTKQIKADKSPVLSVDLASSKVLEERLPHIVAAHVVSEENDAPATEFHWAIDPLDGTAEFIDETTPAQTLLKSESGKPVSTGHGGFSVKIHLAFQGAILMGVVHAPVQNMTFSSIEGGPSWIRKGLGQRHVMQVHEPQPDLFAAQGLVVAFNAKSNPMSRYNQIKKEFAQRGVYLNDVPVTRPGLPRNLQVAMGGVDLHLGRNGYGWDVGADALILKNAGCAMFSMKDGKDLRFDAPRVLGGPYIAARDPSLREKLFPGFEKN